MYVGKGKNRWRKAWMTLASVVCCIILVYARIAYLFSTLGKECSLFMCVSPPATAPLLLSHHKERKKNVDVCFSTFISLKLVASHHPHPHPHPHHLFFLSFFFGLLSPALSSDNLSVRSDRS